ncbi:MAG: hypothetical protein K0U47_09980 [Epsilonproteobacteria bacterium]|nr:hypothetical protein [Campylobacterota bacterium]
MKTELVYNWFQYFSVEMLQKEFKDAGFMIKAFYADVADGDYSKDHTELAVVAVKR